MRGYDQWKTASPYDDDLDPIEEGQRFLKDNASFISDGLPANPGNLFVEFERACDVIALLLDYIEENV